MAELTPDSTQTRDLLRQMQAGNRRAFDQLFAEHRVYLRQFIELRLDHKLRARVDPSDVVQETQMEAYRRLEDYLERRPMPFRLWLRKTADERMQKLRRQHVEAARRAVHRELRIPDQSSLQLAQQLFAPGSSPSRQLSRREVARRVSQAMAQLSEADREILMLRNFEGLSYEEVGFLMEIDPAAARKRYGRALLRLQKFLFESGLLESQP